MVRPYTFRFIAGRLVLDFANTVGYRFNREKYEDHLRTAVDVRRWAKRAGVARFTMSQPLGRAALARIHDVRENAFAVFHAVAAGVPVPLPPLQCLDEYLREYQAQRRLSVRGGRVQWTWHASAGSHAAGLILYPILADAVDLLTSGALNRVRHCADPECGWLFLDRSNSGRRRWCRMADCGNRNKVKRFYRRAADSRG